MQPRYPLKSKWYYKDAMLSIFELFTKPPSLKTLNLKRYLVNFSLNRLASGVDNIHLDVHISNQVHNSLKRTAFLLMFKHSQTEDYSTAYKKEYCNNEKKNLKHLCTDILMDGINKAKAESEVQIDFLGQAALAKMFLEEIKNQYEKLITHFESIIRASELSYRPDQFVSFKIKEKLTEIKLNQNRIVRLVGKELFQILADINATSLRNIRESNFPPEYILPDNFFINPTLHTDNPADDFFLIEEYVLLGQRSEDTDDYESVKSIIYELLAKTDLAHKRTKSEDSTGAHGNVKTNQKLILSTDASALDTWIMEISNIDRMFNYCQSKEQYKAAKSGQESKEIVRRFKSRIEIQKKLLNLFYRKFKKLQLLQLVVAAFEMKSVYAGYCPPLGPIKVREFLLKRWSRKPIVRLLKRQKSLNGKIFSLLPLHKTSRRIKNSFFQKKKKHMLNYLRQFFRYHRDMNNNRILKNGMNAINLIQEEKMLVLSKGNRSLYEYLLPSERVMEDRPIINHVIIKADIRGSIEINNIMRARRLNPASYFSLNFFDPISEILFDYGASKVFIEGDAIILSIFENEDTPHGWYSVARACCLAIRMLQIVQWYNVKNQENSLPILEFGIGICYSQGPPAFLFDGDSRIMISAAINMADRLSGCNKRLRQRLHDHNQLFNIFVFKNATRRETDETANDPYIRYNVNGIELTEDGFAKLESEINLKSIMYPAGKNNKVILYTGKVPTLNGNYETVVIREATILAVKPDTLDVIADTYRKYYEVCTSPEIYEYVKTASRRK